MFNGSLASNKTTVAVCHYTASSCQLQTKLVNQKKVFIDNPNIKLLLFIVEQNVDEKEEKRPPKNVKRNVYLDQSLKKNIVVV